MLAAFPSSTMLSPAASCQQGNLPKQPEASTTMQLRSSCLPVAQPQQLMLEVLGCGFYHFLACRIEL